MWFEALKIIASSVITAIIVGYFFNKRLEERKMLLKFNEQLISSLITSLNTIINELKSIVEKADEIDRQISQHNLTDDTIESFIKLTDNYRTVFRANRFNLAPIMPYGISAGMPDYPPNTMNDLGVSAMNRLIECAQTAKEMNNGEVYQQASGISSRAVADLHQAYKVTSSTANKIVSSLSKGKNIEWGKINDEIYRVLR